MSRIPNSKIDRTEAEKHTNYMGGAGYDVSDPVKRLRIIASSCFFGEPRYYQLDAEDKRPRRETWGMPAPKLGARELEHLRVQLNAIDPREWRNKTPAEAVEYAIDEALNADPEATLREAARLRREDHIRTTPQVILVRAAHHPRVRGTGLLRKFAGAICSRADEPGVGLAYHLWRYKGKPLPNGLKKAWASVLERFDEYQLAKYRLGDRAAKTVDVVNLVHAKSEAIGKLMKGQLSNEGKTWEAIISAEGSTPEAWKKAVDVMGHMALLRNVRNLLQKGIDPGLFADKLVEGAEHGKQLPFRYFSAYKAVESIAPPRVLDAIEASLMISVGKLPRFVGKTMALSDNSGSAWGAGTSAMGTMKIAEIANLTGILAGMASDEGYIGVFGDQLRTKAVRKLSSVFDQLKYACELGASVGGSTENGIWLFWNEAIREKQHWDNVFVFSDMQAGHGGLFGRNPREYSEYRWLSSPQHIDVSKLVNKYRATVNPKVNVYLVQMAGYEDTILPEFYNRTYILGGWGEGLLKFAASMSELDLPLPKQ